MSQRNRNSLHNEYQPAVTGADLSVLYPSAIDDGMPPPAADAAPSSKKRKSSKSKPPPELRRPASTPHIRAPNHVETSPLASPTSEKRRNKLGYHRTSVACG